MAAAEDTGRQRLRIGLHPDWVTPRGEEIQPKVDAYNPDYKPGGGEKKIFHEPVSIQAGSKIDSLEYKDYKPGGGDKPIFNERLEFDKAAKPKVGSLEFADHKPGGGDKQFVHKERLHWTDQPVLNTRENIDFQTKTSDVKIFNDQLDFSDRAAPKVGSLENKDYEPRPSGVRVYHERLPWLEHGSNWPRVRRTSGDELDGGEVQARRRDYAKQIEGSAQHQEPHQQRPRRANSEESAQGARRERQLEFSRRTAAAAAAKPAATQPRRLPNERDPKPRNAAAEAAAEERKRRQQQLQEEQQRREQKRQLQRQKEQKEEREQKEQKEREKQQLQQKQKEEKKREQQQQQQLQQQHKQQQQPGNNSHAGQKASGQAQSGGGKKAAAQGAAQPGGGGSGDSMAKGKKQQQQLSKQPEKQQSKQPEAKKQKTKPAEQQQQQQQQQQQPKSRELDEWEYARHEYERPRLPQQQAADKDSKKTKTAATESSDGTKTGTAEPVPQLELPEQQAGRGVKDLYKTEGYAKRFELAPAAVTNRSLILQPLDNYRHDWSEDADVKVRLDADGRLVLKSNRKVPTKLPRVAAESTEPPQPATYISSISKRERQLYDPKPKRVTGEDLGHLLPRLEHLLEAPAAPKKHYSQYTVERKPQGVVDKGSYQESMRRQRERHGYHVNPEGERVVLISSDDYNNQFYSEVRVKDTHMQPRVEGEYARRYDGQQQRAQQFGDGGGPAGSRAAGEEPQADELSDRLMLQPSDQLPHYRPDSGDFAASLDEGGGGGDFEQQQHQQQRYQQPPPPPPPQSQMSLTSSQQRKQRKFVNWKPGEVLYAAPDRGSAAGAPVAYSEKLQKQRQLQQQHQQQLQQQQVEGGFTGLHAQRKNWFQDYNRKMLAREGNVEKVSERDLLLTTYELY